MPKLEEIEDVDDIDNLDMDLAEFDPNLTTPLAPARPAPSVVRSQDSQPQAADGGPPLFPGMANNPFMAEMLKKLQQAQEGQASGPEDDGATGLEGTARGGPRGPTEEEWEKIRTMDCLYPCYFDKNRSHKQGRRVSVEKAVENPLAKTIYDACRSLNLHVFFEGSKTHPQDFGNPGRVRYVRASNEGDKKLTRRMVYQAVAEYLLEHETNWKRVMELGGPKELDGYVGKDVPRVKGFKMNSIVPLHSPMLYRNPTTDVIYKKEFLDKPKPIAPPTASKNNGPPKPKNKIIRR